MCLCGRSACTPPLLAGVCDVSVCAWALVSAAPRHSWLGSAVWVFVCLVRALLVRRHSWLECALWACVFGLGLWLLPAFPGLGWRGVRVCVRVPLVPRHCWLGCVVWVCVLGLGFQLRPATPGWGVVACVCLCAPSASTPPPLAGACGVGVCAWARVWAAPRHSWLGCWGLCLLLWPLRLYPATPGWGVRCGCVCLGSGFGCTPPLLAGVLGPVCVCVRAPLVPRHSWPGCAVWVCVLELRFGLRPATLGRGVGVCVCACVRAPLVPRHSWLGCAVWMCLPELGFRLRPATPGLGVGACVCLCAPSACTPPLLAGVCSLGACAWARVSAAFRHFWLGCWGVCVLGARSACAPPLLAAVCGVDVCA